MSGLRDEHFVDQVKDAISLSDFIGRTVKLTRSGHSFKGLSPFSREKTPSFYVNDDKRAYHCFSTGKNGDVFTYLMEIERLSFPEALERAAGYAGIQMPAFNPQQAAVRARRERLYDLLARASAWFIGRLQSDDGAVARQYLETRALKAEILDNWGLGYAPTSGGLIRAMVDDGYSENELVDAGVCGRSSDGRIYERFRNRVMFPIEDVRSRRIISFGGRALGSDASAKYLNGSDSLIFKKNQVLYGLQRALALPVSDRRRDRDLVLVEGYFDVIACHAAGVRAVAPLGTAVSEANIDLLWQRCDEPVACLDGDKAGRAAAYRIADRALSMLRPGKSFNFVDLPAGADPDEVLKQSGPDALISAIAQQRPMVDVVYEKEAASIETPTPERVIALKLALLKVCGSIPASDLREAYRRILMARFQTAFGHIDPVFDVGDGGQDAPAPAPVNIEEAGVAAVRPANENASFQPLAASLALAAINHPAWLVGVREGLAETCFGDPAMKTVAAFMRRILGAEEAPDNWSALSLREDLVANGFDDEIAEIERAAHRAKAPYLRRAMPAATAQEIWSQTFTAQNRLYSLTELFAADDGRLIDRLGQTVFYELRHERDRLKTSLDSGYLWEVLQAGIEARGDGE